jgi:4,5-dihydroxyphthalate decarboxylase
VDPVIRVVTRAQGGNAALLRGEVRAEGFTLAFEEVPVLVQAFRRMVRELAYDVAELAVTTYLCAKEHGAAFTALPVLLVRGFHHGAVVRPAGSDLRHPADLAGRRVGVNRGYTVTTGVWARGVLRQEYGLDPATVTWVRSGDEHVSQYRPPPNVVAAPPGRTLADLLASGEIAAAVGIPADPPDLLPLVPDPEEAGYAALRTRGHYPVNHLVVVRDDLLAAHPGLATALTRAFTAAKDRYVRRLAEHGPAPGDPVEAMHHRVMREWGGDPLPYGLAPNRPVLDELVGHALEQRILTRAPDLPALFTPPT